MDNPACSTVDIPSILKTDHIKNTSLFNDSELELQCYHNKGVIVDDEDECDAKEDPLIEATTLPSVGYPDITISEESDNATVENEDHDNEEIEDDEDVNDTLKLEDNSRMSDGESCNSNASSCLTASEHYTKRKRIKEIKNETDGSMDMNDDEEDTNVDAIFTSSKKMKFEESCDAEKPSTEVQRSVIPSKDNLPPHIRKWISIFQVRMVLCRKLAGVNQLIDICEPTLVRHMMQVIEPQFQRDFISLLPKEVRTLTILGYIDNLLWRDKCVKAGVLESISKRYKNRGLPSPSASPWKMAGNTIISGSTDRTLKSVSGSRDATLRVWDIDNGQCLHILVGHVAAVRCVQYDGRLIVSGAYDFTVKVWNPETENCLHTLEGHSNRVYSLQISMVFTLLVVLWDTSIKVWDVETGACKHTLMGHQSLTSGMELRNNILVSGNADSTVKVWDILSGSCLQTLSGEFIRNLVKLDSGGSGRVVWRIRASETKLVCAVGSRNGTEETKLLVLDFDVDAK
ncbi:hypothetical protein ACP70R_050176 [Stipagrostis hirtigluma subsp. patula]